MIRCEKPICLDKVNFKELLMETITSTPHKSYQPEEEEGLYLFYDHTDGELNTDEDDNADTSKINDFVLPLEAFRC